MPPKDAAEMANRVDPDQFFLKKQCNLCWSICSDLIGPILNCIVLGTFHWLKILQYRHMIHYFIAYTCSSFGMPENFLT